MGGVSNIASAGINLALAQQAGRKADKQIKRDRDREIAEIGQQIAAKQQDSQAALRRRIAALRARTGAAGLSSRGGSIDAVVRGLEKETADESAQLNRSAQSRIDGLRDAASNRRRRNLLDMATGLTGLGRGSRSLLR